MNRKRLSEIETISKELLRKFKLDRKPPIDVDLLAKNMGLEIIQHDLEDKISGVLILEKSSGRIGVNKSHPPVRKRFTIAHEIGHYILQHARKGSVFVDLPYRHMSLKMFRDSNSSTGEKWQEREANAFAASLLMPADLISSAIKKYSFDLTDDQGTGSGDDLDKMAVEFKVSSQAMAFRLSNLGYLSY